VPSRDQGAVGQVPRPGDRDDHHEDGQVSKPEFTLPHCAWNTAAQELTKFISWLVLQAAPLTTGWFKALVWHLRSLFRRSFEAEKM
jgi:hypothetical protein